MLLLSTVHAETFPRYLDTVHSLSRSASFHATRFFPFATNSSQQGLCSTSGGYLQRHTTVRLTQSATTYDNNTSCSSTTHITFAYLTGVLRHCVWICLHGFLSTSSTPDGVADVDEKPWRYIQTVGESLYIGLRIDNSEIIRIGTIYVYTCRQHWNKPCVLVSWGSNCNDMHVATIVAWDIITWQTKNLRTLRVTVRVGVCDVAVHTIRRHGHGCRCICQRD